LQKTILKQKRLIWIPRIDPTSPQIFRSGALLFFPKSFESPVYDDAAFKFSLVIPPAMSTCVVSLFVLFVCVLQVLCGQERPPQVHDSSRGQIKHQIKQYAHIHSHAHISASVPVLSVSLTDARHRYLLRLMLSIDYPVSLLLVTAGNTNATTLNSLREDFNEGKTYLESKFPHSKAIFGESAINPGSVAGFNTAIRSLLGLGSGSSEAPRKPEEPKPAATSNHLPKWALVVNADIAFYPGVLKTIAIGVNRLLSLNSVATGPRFGLGFTSLCCGSEWSAVVLTEDLVRAVGKQHSVWRSLQLF
jgi:hypothetical protein